MRHDNADTWFGGITDPARWREWVRLAFSGWVDTLFTLIGIALVTLVLVAWIFWSQATALGLTVAAGILYAWYRAI